MSVPTTLPMTSPVTSTAVRVSITVTVGDDAQTFASTAEALGVSDPYRLARSMTHAVRDDAANYLMERER